MISIDANILIYAADADAGERHVRAKEVMAAANSRNTALTEQAIFEFFHASTRKGKMSIGDATTVVREFATNFPMLQSYREIVEDALAIQSRYRLSIWDARIVAVCGAHGCDHLLSEDLQDGAQYGNVRIVNPFNAANAGLVERLLS